MNQAEQIIAKQPEIRSLTGLRGAAAVLVVFYHYAGPSQPSGFISRILDHGYLAVDLFFVLSGFVMALTYSHMFVNGGQVAAYFKFLGRRIARVYPLYAIATLCAAFLVYMGWLEYRLHQLGLDTFLDLTMTQVWFSRASLDSPGWSISAEWTAYLLFPGLLHLCLSPRRWLSWITLFGALALIVYFVQMPREDALAGKVAIARCIGEFILGLFAYRMLRVPSINALRDIPWLEPVVMLMLVFSLGFRQGDLATVVICPCLIFLLSSDRWLVSRLLGTRLIHRLGVLSFSIYLIHFLLSGLMNGIHHYANDHGRAHGQTYAIFVAVPLTYLLAHLACRWIEIPGRRLVRHLLEDRLGNLRAKESLS